MSHISTLYDLLRQLDRLEELREDLQEFALRGGAALEEDEEADADPLDEAALLAEMQTLGVKTLGEVEERIAELNERIDQLEAAEGGA